MNGLDARRLDEKRPRRAAADQRHRIEPFQRDPGESAAAAQQPHGGEEDKAADVSDRRAAGHVGDVRSDRQRHLTQHRCGDRTGDENDQADEANESGEEPDPQLDELEAVRRIETGLARTQAAH